MRDRAVIAPFTLAALVLATLCSCSLSPEREFSVAAPATRETALTTAVYECQGEMRLPVTIRDGAAWVFLPGRTIRLPQVPAGSGSRYSDGTSVYWTKGETAVITTEEKAYTGCRNNPTLAVWEHAKVTGVDFRAQGNEPGWHLELRPERIDFTGDYGTTRHTFSRPQPDPDISSDSQTIYRTGDRENTLTLMLRPERCLDSMSGERFATTVVVWLNGVRLKGCGRALH